MGYYFLVICQKLQNDDPLNLFLNTGPYGAGNLKTVLLLQFSSIPSKFIAYHGKCRLLRFLAIGQVLQNLWHSLICESMGKDKMCNISKTAGRRAKQTKIWDSWYYSAHMEVTIVSRFIEFGLGSFGKISNFTILSSAWLFQQSSWNRISSFVRSSSYVCGIDYLWTYCMDVIFLRIFLVFVNMGPYGSKNFKILLLPQITFESFETFSEFSSQ